MPPNERRIVHIELRDHPEVETESDGEDPKRKVVVRLKR
jgi:spoIIIJ-associated protein